MTCLSFAGALAVLVLSALLHSHCLASNALSTTIRATDCIANSTHCHCSMVQAKSDAICLKPIANLPGKCVKDNCAAGFKCDCESSVVCEMKTVTGYKTTDKSSATTVSCTKDTKSVPKTAVSHTSDFHITAYQESQLFVNSDQIGFVRSSDYQVFTSEIKSGDVIAVQARRLSQARYGVKLRFLDLQLETRFIDENWYSTSSYDASWLDKSFDPAAAGWIHPSIASTVSEPAFDKDVPWMWHGTSDIMYARYVIP